MTFKRKEGWTDRPVSVPCGRCSGCRLERSRQWAIRILHESSLHKKNSFITMTYDDAQIPSDGGLDLEHWQKFAKRTRQKMGRFRFYHCGEYGDRLMRPHYHACIFGQDWSEDRTKWEASKTGQKQWTSKTLDELWGHGITRIGELNYDSAAYCARYIMKKITGELAIPHYGHLKPEYSTMSRRPGIASEWIEKYGKETYQSDSVIIKGREVKPPKYYDTRFEIKDEEGFHRAKSARRERAEKQKHHNTPERLEVRERVQKAELKTKTRKYEKG